MHRTWRDVKFLRGSCYAIGVQSSVVSDFSTSVSTINASYWVLSKEERSVGIITAIYVYEGKAARGHVLDGKEETVRCKWS